MHVYTCIYIYSICILCYIYKYFILQIYIYIYIYIYLNSNQIIIRIGVCIYTRASKGPKIIPLNTHRASPAPGWRSKKSLMYAAVAWVYLISWIWRFMGWNWQLSHNNMNAYVLKLSHAKCMQGLLLHSPRSPAFSTFFARHSPCTIEPNGLKN